MTTSGEIISSSNAKRYLEKRVRITEQIRKQERKNKRSDLEAALYTAITVLGEEASAVEPVMVADLAVEDPVPPPAPQSVARDEQFDEIRRAVALLEARLLALESNGTELSSESSDRRDSIESVESVDFVPSERKSHVLLLLGLAYNGNSKTDWYKLRVQAHSARQGQSERARVRALLPSAL